MNKITERWEKTGFLDIEKDIIRRNQLALDLEKIQQFMISGGIDGIQYHLMLPIYVRCFHRGCYPEVNELAIYLKKMEPALIEFIESKICWLALDAEVEFCAEIAESLIRNKKYKDAEELKEALVERLNRIT